MARSVSAGKRFQAKVKKIPGGCWLWTGCQGRKGYGWFYVNGRDVLAHRFAWERRYGPLLPGLGVCVLHRCDNPRCVRPSHLFLGTHQDNVADRHAKGRTKPGRGERHGSAKLTAEAVQEIRRLAAAGASHRSLGRQYRTSRQNISAVLSGKTWRYA